MTCVDDVPWSAASMYDPAWSSFALRPSFGAPGTQGPLLAWQLVSPPQVPGSRADAHLPVPRRAGLRTSYCPNSRPPRPSLNPTRECFTVGVSGSQYLFLMPEYLSCFGLLLEIVAFCVLGDLDGGNLELDTESESRLVSCM